MPKVSIIIPSYNAEAYLPLCLDSVIAQNYKNIEIIIIDDKSTDNSILLIEEYQKAYPHITLIKLDENRGVSHARNVGIDVALGDYLFFIDSDDYIEEDTITKLVNMALENDADIVDIERIFWYKHNQKIMTFLDAPKKHRNIFLGDIYSDTRSISMPRYVTGKLYKRSIIGDIRFDERLRCYEDVLFNHQIKTKFTNYVYAKDVFYHYLQRPVSLININNTNHIDYLYAGKKIKDIYINNNYYFGKIKKIIDWLILSDIFVIMIFKIPKIDQSLIVRDEVIADFMELVDDLNVSYYKKPVHLILKMFKNNRFQSFYFSLVSRLNPLDLGFKFLNIMYPYKIKDEVLRQKITSYFDKIN